MGSAAVEEGGVEDLKGDYLSVDPSKCRGAPLGVLTIRTHALWPKGLFKGQQSFPWPLQWVALPVTDNTKEASEKETSRSWAKCLCGLGEYILVPFSQ